MIINKDAFSNGQIDSKLWLCSELEKLFEKIDSIWIYGGWYGITAFLLRSRNNISINKIYSFDIDPNVATISDTINENWVIKDWQFKAFTKDCNNLVPHLDEVDLIINTSTEHFNSMQWFENIPKNTKVVLQGNNMPHDDHCINFNSLEDFTDTFKLSEIYFQGKKDFMYPEWNFSRYMIIGNK